MSINREKYDGVHYQVVTMNMRDGSVQGHAHGCADLKRGRAKFAEPSQADDFMDVTTKADAWLDYNADFLAEGGEDNAWPIEWLPCASHIPAGDTHAVYEENFGDATPVAYQSEVVTHEPVVTTRVGRKWTYVFVDGAEVAYVRNDMVALVLATLGA